MTDDDKDMVIWLHDKARQTNNDYYRKVADRLNELAKEKINGRV